MKMLVKVQIRNKSCWVHFCYLSKDTIPSFLKITCDTSFSCLLSKWAKNDFMIDSMNTLSDVDRLRAAIKIHYKEKYPEIFIDTSTDAQGWIKIWCRTHILEEVLNNEN